MSGGWPSIIDPIQLADQGARLVAELPLKGMRRLTELCLDDAGSAMIDLQFERNDVDDLRMMSGTIATRLRLTCQRCLEPFELELIAKPRLLLLPPGMREQAEESAESPLDTLSADQPVALSALVEDELLLAMPMIPMHPPGDCRTRQARDRMTPAADKPNPFSVLEQLKRTDRD